MLSVPICAATDKLKSRLQVQEPVHAGTEESFIAEHLCAARQCTQGIITPKLSCVTADPNKYLLQSRYHSAPELPVLDSLLAAPDLNIYTPQAAAQNPRRVGAPGANVQQSGSPVLAASPGQIRTADVAADVAGSPGGARSGAGGRPRQGIIRTQSQDFTIE